MKTQRYTLENPHNYFIGIKDNQAPEGAKYVKYWNDLKRLPEAKKMTETLNNSSN